MPLSIISNGVLIYQWTDHLLGYFVNDNTYHYEIWNSLILD